MEDIQKRDWVAPVLKGLMVGTVLYGTFDLWDIPGLIVLAMIFIGYAAIAAES